MEEESIITNTGELVQTGLFDTLMAIESEGIEQIGVHPSPVIERGIIYPNLFNLHISSA